MQEFRRFISTKFWATMTLAFLTTTFASVGELSAFDGKEPGKVISPHVIVISIDGLRPDAIDRFGLKTLQYLVENGSSASDAQTIFPSRTLPSHTSMLTGVGPEKHGITWNRMTSADVVAVPTMFELARNEGFHTAAFFSKAKLRHLIRENSLDHWQGPGSNLDNWMATRTVPLAVEYMRHEKPNLMFVHVGEPDFAGHRMGWMGFLYGVAAKRADAAVSEVLKAAEDTYGEGNFTIIVTADHGGHDKDHGSDHLDDMTIPWIAYGQGVAGGAKLTGIKTMDTAATALWILGVNQPVDFDGAHVAGAFISGEPTVVVAP